MDIDGIEIQSILNNLRNESNSLLPPVHVILAEASKIKFSSRRFKKYEALYLSEFAPESNNTQGKSLPVLCPDSPIFTPPKYQTSIGIEYDHSRKTSTGTSDHSRKGSDDRSNVPELPDINKKLVFESPERIETLPNLDTEKLD